MYFPLNFGGIIKGLMAKLTDAKAQCPDWLCLSEHTSKWNMDIYVAVDHEVPGADNCQLSGRYYCKVYEGDFKDTKQWCDDFAKQAGQQHIVIGKQYMWYTICPKCAKERGKNYVVVVGEVTG
jgi:hypothetical protein